MRACGTRSVIISRVSWLRWAIVDLRLRQRRAGRDVAEILRDLSFAVATSMSPASTSTALFGPYQLRNQFLTSSSVAASRSAIEPIVAGGTGGRPDTSPRTARCPRPGRRAGSRPGASRSGPRRAARRASPGRSRRAGGPCGRIPSTAPCPARWWARSGSSWCGRIGGAVLVGRADQLERLEEFALVVLRALEHQVLEQVREAGAAGRLVLAADVVPDVDRDDRRLAVGVHDHAQAVGQGELLVRDVDGGGLRRGAAPASARTRAAERSRGRGQGRRRAGGRRGRKAADMEDSWETGRRSDDPGDRHASRRAGP